MTGQAHQRQDKQKDPVTVVKLGGSLAPRIAEIIPALRSAHRPLLIVPGGGAFADVVRHSGAGTDADAAHWMACAAMDQYGWILAAQGIGTTPRIARPGHPCVLLPYCALRRYDPLPHSWDVTSDTITAWVAGRLGGDLLVLKSVDGITVAGKLLTLVKKPVLMMSSIHTSSPTCSNTGSGHLSSTAPTQPGYAAGLGGGGFAAPALVQPFKGTKRDTIGILKGAISCQIKSVRPAALRLQKRAQQSLRAPRAVSRSPGATGAGSRVFPTSARNADSGDREAWATLP